MKIIKPLQLSLLPKAYKSDHGYKLAVSIVALFGFDLPSNILSETELWKCIPEELGNDANFDLAMPKPHGEVLLNAKYFPPPQAPNSSAGSVRFQMGSIQKTLNVFGDRYWEKNSSGQWMLSKPQPFDSLDISWENSFGGKQFPKNPLGKGFIDNPQAANIDLFPAANITDPRFPPSSPLDNKVDPAGFGAYDLTWPQRFSKVGTHDKYWLDNLFPGFAADFDPSFFNCAPQDQQLRGYFTGDETFLCENMHPEKQRIQSQLPAIRPRCFIDRLQGDEDFFQELAVNLDTVWLFPHREQGLLIYRALTDVQDDDASDIPTVLAAYERLSDSPRDTEHYHTALQKRNDEEKGHLYLLNEKDLVPENEESAIHSLLKEGEKKLGDSLFQQNMQNKLNREIDNAKEKLEALGLNPEDYFDTPADQQTDLSLDNLEELDVITDKLLQQAQDKQKQMEQKGREMIESMGIDYDKTMEDAQKRSGGRIRFSAEEIIGKLHEAGLYNPGTEKKLHEAEKQVDAIYRQYGQYFAPGAESSQEQKRKIREIILDGYAKKQQFKGMDFTGADLSGLNLEGIDLGETFLEGADLSGANLSNADLRNCMLARSNLSGCNCSQSHMEGVNLGQADLTESNFSGARLDSAVLYQAKLTNTLFDDASMVGTDLSECSGHGTRLLRANLSQTRFIESSLKNMDFTGSRLDEALFLNTTANKINFTNAQLISTILVQCQWDGAIFTNADLTNLRAAMGICFRAADFRGATITDANFRGAALWGANFEKADISQSDFSECDLEYAILYRAVAKQTMFMKTILNNANMISVNLFEGSLQKARLENTDLSGANLFAADLLQTDFSHTLLRGANVQKTILNKWSPS